MDHYQALNIRQFFLNGQKLTDEWGKKGIYHFEYTPGEPLKYISEDYRAFEQDLSRRTERKWSFLGEYNLYISEYVIIFYKNNMSP